VIAKVTRDRQCLALHEAYPHYGFDRHKGYGTEVHYAAIAEHGLTPQHRRSFLKHGR
jgi:ribonuclease HII